MAIALVASVKATPGANGGTTAAIDTTGATLLIAIISGYSATSVSDSASNTWTALTSRAGGTSVSRLFYVANPTTSATHTLTYNVASSFPVIMFAAFSGVTTTSPFDVENGAGAAGTATSIQTGSITPANNGSLIIAGVTAEAGADSLAIDSSMTILQSAAFGGGNNVGGGSAYYIQPTAGAINPTFSWTTTTTNRAASIAAFIPAAGGGVVKTVNGLAYASVKTINGLAVASVKTWNGMATQ